MPHLLSDIAAIAGAIAAVITIWIALGIAKRAAHGGD